MTTPPTPEAVEAAFAYSSMNHKVDAISEDVQRILWANVQPDCTGYSSAYALTAARILAAEVGRLREALEALLEPQTEECRLDHHGYCQAHYLESANSCCVAKARAALAKEDETLNQKPNE